MSRNQPPIWPVNKLGRGDERIALILRAQAGRIMQIVRTAAHAWRRLKNGRTVVAPGSARGSLNMPVGAVASAATPPAEPGARYSVAICEACYGTNFTAASHSCCGETNSKMLATEQSVPATAGARVSFDFSPAGAVSKNITPISRR